MPMLALIQSTKQLLQYSRAAGCDVRKLVTSHQTLRLLCSEAHPAPSDWQQQHGCQQYPKQQSSIDSSISTPMTFHHHASYAQVGNSHAHPELLSISQQQDVCHEHVAEHTAERRQQQQCTMARRIGNDCTLQSSSANSDQGSSMHVVRQQAVQHLCSVQRHEQLLWGKELPHLQPSRFQLARRTSVPSARHSSTYCHSSLWSSDQQQAGLASSTVTDRPISLTAGVVPSSTPGNMQGSVKAFGTSSCSNLGSSSSSSSSKWWLRPLPAACAPYAQLMRLDKPIGSWLLAWPGLWSIALAATPGHLPDPWLTALFGVGAVLMRGAGCTINDLWDRDIDRQVERTRTRPLAAGTVTPTSALVFLAAQLSASLAILLQLNTYTQVLGVASLGLVVTYPLMKRVTWWPQAFLGLAMNYGVLMGYAAAGGACDWSVVLPLYAAGVNWTLIYDTIYAHQDKRDDALVGVKSTALLFGDKTRQWSTAFAVAQASGMVLAGCAAGCGPLYFASVAAGSSHIAWQISSVDLQDGADCMDKFVSNKWYGAIIYAGIVVDKLLVG